MSNATPTAKKQLLLECAEAFEENCEHEGKLTSFAVLAQRCRAAARAESDLLSAVQLLIEAPTFDVYREKARAAIAKAAGSTA